MAFALVGFLVLLSAELLSVLLAFVAWTFLPYECAVLAFVSCMYVLSL